MKKQLSFLLLSAFILLFPALPSVAQAPEIQEGTIFVYLTNGGVEAYAPSALDGEHYMAGDNLCVPLKGGELKCYAPNEYDSCSVVCPSFPFMTSFKFNNKYNHNLHVDAVADSIGREMKFSLNSIGKWLTPSFNMSDPKAVAYVDTVLQVSKESRLSFANGVKYVVTYPGYIMHDVFKFSDEVWNVEQLADITEIPLTADMLSTNKPSTKHDEGLENLLDGNPRTIFHSTWGSANDATLHVNAYIDIELPTPADSIKIYYQCRPSTGYNPLEWQVYAGNSTSSLRLVRTLTSEYDGMPTGGAGQEYTSPIIDLGGEYSHVRILQTRGEYSKNHLAISELRLYDVENVRTVSTLVSGPVYVTRRVPFGNEYNVSVDWLIEDAVSVPRIDIDIEGGRFVTSKEIYLKAKFSINGYGVYEDFVDSVQIKGRGNTSWGYSKKPYRLKFAEKVKPFGLTKGKSWVLLANAQKGSLMANAVAMKMGQMIGTQYPNHIVPVELYMNGYYMGSYMFTEKVGLANNSVDVDEETGYLLELDTYYDETYKFRSTTYNLPVNVKEPDLTEFPADVVNERFSMIQNEFNVMASSVAQNQNVASYIDMDAYARFMLANDYALNMEIGHPKSTFLFKEDEGNPNSLFKFGPIWDFDWGFGYEDGGHTYCYTGATSSLMKTSMSGYSFLRDLRGSELFKRNYYRVWTEFVANNSFDELMDYIDAYYNFAAASFSNNTTVWGSSCGYTETDRDRMKDWLKTRYDYILGGLTVYNIDEMLYPLPGDVECDGAVTVHDVTSAVAYVNGEEVENFYTSKGDCNGNGVVNKRDLPLLAGLVLDAEAPSPMYWFNTPVALGTFGSEALSLELGGSQTVPLSLDCVPGEEYCAFQFDIVVPEGVFIDDVTAATASQAHELSFAQLDMNTYRVLAYSADNSLLGPESDIVNLSVSTFSVIEEPARNMQITNAYIVDAGNTELRIADTAVPFTLSTSIGNVCATASVTGGDCIVVTALEKQNVAVYGVDGRLVRRVAVDEGTTRIEVPAGMYIVAGNKVLVRP